MALTVAGGALMTPPAGPGRLIEVIGDSISCGYGTLGTLADSDCFPTESHWDTLRRRRRARRSAPRSAPIATSGQGMPTATTAAT